MGCFDATCTFTRTAIRYGDEVLLVGVKPFWDKTPLTTYNLLNHINDEDVIRFAVVGKYNDYGFIEDESLDKSQGLDVGYCFSNWQFLVHLEIVEGLFNCKLRSLPDLKYIVQPLVSVARQARIELITTFLLGYQFSDPEEVELQKKILSATDRILKRKEVEFKGQEFKGDE